VVTADGRVDAPTDADHPAVIVLVAERVGQSLYRRRSRERVAVQDEKQVHIP
jgi:hypothetical protein